MEKYLDGTRKNKIYRMTILHFLSRNALPSKLYGSKDVYEELAKNVHESEQRPRDQAEYQYTVESRHGTCQMLHWAV
jgi:hypothetical protein